MRRFLLLGLLVVSALQPGWGQEQDFTYGSLLQASDGNLYGVTLGPDSDAGFFSQTPSGTFTILTPHIAPLLCLEGPDGSIYGVNNESYPSPQIVRLTLLGDESVFATLPSGKSAGCPAMASDGNYYGASASGGANGQGYLYQVTPAGSVTDFYDFNGTTDGGGPTNTPVEGSDGKLYLYNSGNLLTYNRGAGLMVTPESAPVTGALVEGADGNFYGLSEYVAVEQVQPSGAATTIFQTEDVGYHTLQGPFVDGDGSLSLVQFIPFTGPNCGGGAYVSFFPIGLSGIPGAQYFQIGAAVDEYYIDTYSASNIFLSGTGTYYATTTEDVAEQADYCAGYQWLSIFSQAPAPLPTPPIQMTLSRTHVLPGASVDLAWRVNNAFSKTMQQCYGYGGLAGKVALSGSKTFSAVEAGVHTYSVVCGGTEVGLATLTAVPTVPLTLSSSAAVLTPDLPVTLTAQIGGVGTPAPTGTVTFFHGARVLGSAAVNSAGTAALTFSTQGVPPGSYTVTASYSGDGNYGPGTAAPVGITMLAAKGATTLALTALRLTAQEGFDSGFVFEAVPTGSLSENPPSGVVTLYYGSHILMSAALGSDGVFSGFPNDSVILYAAIGDQPAGSYTVYATYAGDSWNTPAVSNTVTVTVQTLSVNMTATPNPVPQGSSVTFAVQTAGSKSVPTGTVMFYVGSQAVASATLNSSGGASVTLPPDALAPGSYQVSAYYGGDSVYDRESSPTIPLVVQ